MEVWKPIEGCDGYEVSNLGRVKSFWRRKKPHILKPTRFCGSDYLHVVFIINGKRKYFAIHRLVAKAFVPNPENKPCVNHINGVKTDNRAENLEWVTYSENLQHAYKTGLHKRKFTNEQICYMRDNPDNFTIEQLGELFNTTPTKISEIQLGKLYPDAGGYVRAVKFHCHRVSNDLRAQICAEYKPRVVGCGCTALAKKYGISAPTVLRIVKETNSNKL